MNPREYISCKFCGADDARPLFVSWDMWHNLDDSEKEKFSFVKCRQCGFVYQNPRVPPDAIEAYYPDDYVSHTPSDLSQRTRSLLSRGFSRLARLPNRFWETINLGPYARQYRGERSNLTRGLFDEMTHESGSRSEGIQRMLKWHEKTLAVRADPFNFPADKLRILDIGCGMGRYLERRQKQGWETYGVEPSAHAVEICHQKGLNVRQGYFDPADWEANSFDMVTMFQVVEHLPDPELTFRQILPVLKPGGLLYVTLPNWRSIPAHVFRTYWIGADLPRHYFLFTPSLLEKMLTRVGYRPVKWYTQSSTSGYTAALEFILRERFGFRIKQDRIRKNRVLCNLTVPLVRLVDRFNWGDNLHMIAQKQK